MNIEVIENVVMLSVAIIGLMTSLFRYVKYPRNSWLFLTVFFLAHFLSDYYWATFTLVMGFYPDVSALIAYFGWNVGYGVLLICVILSKPPQARKLFHPLMLLPVALNIWQFILYLPFGGIFNNLIQGCILTAVSCFSIQTVIYYIKNRRNGAHFPHFHVLTLLFVFTQYGIWTSTCFEWPGALTDPYYYFSFANCCIVIFFSWAAAKDYEAEGFSFPERSASEIKFQALVQIIASFVILGGCIGGYYAALRMKNTIPPGTESQEVYNLIAITLFVISIVLVVLVLGLLLVIAVRYRNMEQNIFSRVESIRSRYSFLFTILITLVLMVFSVAYTSRLFYRGAISNIYEAGKDSARLSATELENYMTEASSILEVTADAIELMLDKNEDQETVYDFLTFETDRQFVAFDDNFTSIYGLLRGEYMDGSGWIPPEGFVPEERDWYKSAVENEGKTTIVQPYVDAMTDSVVITICRSLEDKHASYGDSKSVIALDVKIGHIQETTDEADIGGRGFAMIFDRKGMIITHRDPKLAGEDFNAIYGTELFDTMVEKGNGVINADIDGQDHTLFFNRVMDQWYIAIAVSNKELFKDMYSQLAVNLVVSVVIFALISLFYYLGYKNELAYGKKMEEMRIFKQKQDYNARVLKLEKRTADEANKAKSSFLADMSHEIRTPINAILGMNEMILREADDDDIREYARNIKISGRNLLQLINGILDFSKIEDGKMEIVPVRYHTGSFITYLYNSIAERVRDKGLKLFIEMDPLIPSELFGDDSRLGQIVMNLLTNAVKYTPEGTVTLTIKEKERSDGRVRLYFEVKDTGIGIKDSDMEKLFESFERLDLVKNRNIEGTGLGMSITTKLLKLMDSELKVESVYGEGSVFSFELWQKIEDETPIGDYRLYHEEEKPEGERIHLYAPSAHVLIADDTKLNIIVVEKLLKRTGIKLDKALNGREAVELSEANAYDVILMDQRMPGMDGSQALKAIRELENGMNADTPVICLTADAIRGARDRYLADGFTDYLTKPVEGDVLENMLYKYLPPDKREKSADKEQIRESESENAQEGFVQRLFDAGVDVDEGMVFCQDDEDTYRVILSEFAGDYDDRSRSLEDYYENKDWDNYRIFIHSLKSSAKTIGAGELSKLAAGLEAAAKENDSEAIKKDHDRAMELYKTITVAIRSIGVNGESMGTALTDLK